MRCRVAAASARGSSPVTTAPAAQPGPGRPPPGPAGAASSGGVGRSVRAAAPPAGGTAHDPVAQPAQVLAAGPPELAHPPLPVPRALFGARAPPGPFPAGPSRRAAPCRRDRTAGPDATAGGQRPRWTSATPALAFRDMRKTLLGAGLALLLAITACAEAEPDRLGRHRPDLYRPGRRQPAGRLPTGPGAGRADAGQPAQGRRPAAVRDDLRRRRTTRRWAPTPGRRPARSGAPSSPPPATRPGRCSPATSTGTPTPRWCCAPTRPTATPSVSLVDISYLGAGRPRRPGHPGRRRLLDAPLLPFDGMNERGLAVGLAADDAATARPVPGEPTVGSVRILRLVLDRAATVDEAVAVLRPATTSTSTAGRRCTTCSPTRPARRRWSSSSTVTLRVERGAGAAGRR